MINFWIIALSKKWATIGQVKEAYEYEDITKEELQEGVDNNILTPEEYEEIVGESYILAEETTESPE
ncbi:XkdX family protein [Bacillus subtilis]